MYFQIVNLPFVHCWTDCIVTLQKRSIPYRPSPPDNSHIVTLHIRFIPYRPSPPYSKEFILTYKVVGAPRLVCFNALTAFALILTISLMGTLRNPPTLRIFSEKVSSGNIHNCNLIYKATHVLSVCVCV